MITFSISTDPLLAQKTDCYAFILEEGFTATDFPQPLKAFVRDYMPNLAQVMKKQDFTGKSGDILVIPCMIDKRTAFCIVAGMGKQSPKDASKMERYRRALGTIIKVVRAHNGRSLALSFVPARSLKTTQEHIAQQTATALLMADYHFDEYISEKRKKDIAITICVDAKNKKAVQKGVTDGEYIGNAVNKARHWVDLPPSVLTPPQLADKAKAIAKKHGLGITVFTEKQIIKMGMGGLAAVSRGSALDCSLVVMEYWAKKKTAPTLVFVGKGITFDSGGLSLKPPQHMETMKEDMSGAAAVIATMQVIAQLKPNVNIIGITPLAENLPSGKATKPGDIVRFYNGKTAEIKNTDAEGRLILADALSYAVKHYTSDAIVDLATLTGICAHALGPFYSGLMSEHEDLVDRMLDAADLSGDRLWRLPMHDDYKPAIKSTVADICNTGNPKIKAGTITAAHFLQHFVDDASWAHVDIAGTAFDVPDISYYRPGATGVGVRLLVALAMNW